MLKSTLHAWVKNVYSMGMTYSKGSGRLYTKKYKVIKNLLSSVDKTLVIPNKIPYFPTNISTIKTIISALLIWYLYPFSTAPTINSTE